MVWFFAGVVFFFFFVGGEGEKRKKQIVYKMAAIDKIYIKGNEQYKLFADWII